MKLFDDALEFPIILEKLKEMAVSDGAREQIDRLEPALQEVVCLRRMDETTAARRVLDALGAPPLPMMKNLVETLTLSEIGAMLTPEQLTGVSLFAGDCKRMANYLARSASQDATLASYRLGIAPLDELSVAIGNCVAEDQVLDDASALLRDLRRKMLFQETKIKEKITQILQSRKAMLSDGYSTQRGGHYVLPVQRRYQSQFGGTVIDTSATGATLFMEPASIARFQEELTNLSIQEDEEVRRILYSLSASVAKEASAIRSTLHTMLDLDVLFAKAKLSVAMRAQPVRMGTERKLDLREGRHPLLDPETCVPLTLTLSEEDRGVILTGPNTGGKTVALKTVGLLSLMAQCGLHIPCAQGSYLAMQDAYWCDIGDSQSLKQNLSTFSGHITNVIRILQNASRDSLVLLDELGSGTDPAEGMGIAIAVLEELRRRGCQFLVTTHYPQVKTYAESAEHVLSARMAFDPETLAPLYRLELGRSGESCALMIAQRLGMPPELLARAHQAVYGGTENVSLYTPSGFPALRAPQSRLVSIPMEKQHANPAGKFDMGDSVLVLPGNETGIVYRPADDLGNVIVQVKEEKRIVKHTRLQLRVPASELYPPDYDFSILFDTVANRKANRVLSKRYDPEVSIVREKEDLTR